MARKKTVPDEPEFSDSALEDTPQYLEGEAPVEGAQDTALDGGTPPDSAVPPDGDFPIFPEDAPPFEVQDTEVPEDTAIADAAAGDNPPEPEGPVPEEDYGAILQEMGSTAPVEDAPLMLDTDTSQEAPDGENNGDTPTPNAEMARPAPFPVSSPRRERVLTIDAHTEIQTQEDLDDITWHEIQNAYRTRRILTGTLDGIERTDSGLTLAVVSYKGFRVAIPMKEMMLHTGPAPANVEHAEWMGQLQRILSSRLGSEIDFVIKGIENKSRSIVASRREAMLRKRRTFYMDAARFVP